MTITEAFTAIKKDETLCARRVTGKAVYRFQTGSVRKRSARGHSYTYVMNETMLTPADILADWEVIPLASLNKEKQ